MMRRNLWMLPGLALLLLVPVYGRSSIDRAALDAVLRGAVERRQVPAVVAAVGTKEGVSYLGSVGLPADAIVNIASMTKPVTSVAVMQLVERGRVRLDEPAGSYVPELRNIQVLENGALRAPKSPVTVRQLLTHTSGFGYEFLNAELAERVRAGKLATLFSGTNDFMGAPLVSDPGTRWEYGISTDWLGRLVERVSGQTLEAYFRANIFEPLGMRDTGFEVPKDKASRLAARHQRQADGSFAAMPAPPPGPPPYFSGGGGLHSTAGDYLTFARALLAGGGLDGRRILDAATVDLMGRSHLGALELATMRSLAPQFVVADLVLPGAPDAFGLGFALNRKPLASGRSAGTLSWSGLFNTYFWIDREAGVCAVVMSQVLPFGHPAVTQLVDDFDRAVYRALR